MFRRCGYGLHKEGSYRSCLFLDLNCKKEASIKNGEYNHSPKSVYSTAEQDLCVFSRAAA